MAVASQLNYYCERQFNCVFIWRRFASGHRWQHLVGSTQYKLLRYISAKSCATFLGLSVCVCVETGRWLDLADLLTYWTS